MFPGTLSYSLAGRALKNALWSYSTINLRDFGLTRHHNVDDTAYGGGNGLVMRPDVLGNAIDFALKQSPNSPIYYPSPRGVVLKQSICHEISHQKNIIILCGRFEGIDERIIEEYNVLQISIGDYIISGGEVAANVILDAVIRLIPGVVVNQDSLKEESFETGLHSRKLLEYPLYTKPAVWRGRKVPEVLLSGNHQEIAKWKEGKSLKITKKLRPDLLGEG